MAALSPAGSQARECTWARDPVPFDIDPAPVDVRPVPVPNPPVVNEPLVPDSPVQASAMEVSAHVPSNVNVPVLIPVVQTLTSAPAKVSAAVASGASTSVTKRPAVDVAFALPKEHSSDPVYVKSYEAVRDAVQKWKRGKLDKMTTPEMNKCILDTLWEKGCNHDCPDLFEKLLACVTKLKKTLHATLK